MTSRRRVIDLVVDEEYGGHDFADVIKRAWNTGCEILRRSEPDGNGLTVWVFAGRDYQLRALIAELELTVDSLDDVTRRVPV